MESVSGFLEEFDFAKFLPKIGKIIGSVRFWIVLLMYVGSLVLLGFGLWYYLKPAKEPNTKTGFRIYPAMGSVDAWQFTQKLAGIVWTGLGGVLTVITVFVSLIFKGGNTLDMVSNYVTWMGVQAVLALISYGGIYLTVFLRYSKKLPPEETTEE